MPTIFTTCLISQIAKINSHFIHLFCLKNKCKNRMNSDFNKEPCLICKLTIVYAEKALIQYDQLDLKGSEFGY